MVLDPAGLRCSGFPKIEIWTEVTAYKLNKFRGDKAAECWNEYVLRRTGSRTSGCNQK